jgi:hypothetical protein
MAKTQDIPAAMRCGRGGDFWRIWVGQGSLFPFDEC